VHGFLPISHLVQVSSEVLEEDREAILEEYVGRSMYLKVIECEPARGRVVFSERAALASTGRRIQLLNDLKTGDCIRGVVTNITDFGIFVDLGGVEGLVHVSEISWGRVRHPSDAAHLGQEVTAYVIQVDRDRSRIALSLKRLCSNPWAFAEEHYKPGQVVDAVITSVVPFGAFARLEEGLDGLIHVTEMGQGGESVDPADFLSEGQPVQVRILHIDAGRQRLGLSMNLAR
jgi:small subunit ribosomal protein S1